MKNITAQEKYLNIKTEEINKFIEYSIKHQESTIETSMRKGQRKIGYVIGYPANKANTLDKYGEFGEEAWKTMREKADNYFKEQGYWFDGSYICW